MTVADDALALAATLTTLANAAASGDADAARSCASELTRGASSYNAAAASLVAATTALSMARAALSRSVRAIETLKSTDGGPLGDNVYPRANAAAAAAGSLGDYVATAIQNSLSAFGARVHRQHEATKEQAAAASDLTSAIARASQLVAYLEAL